MTTVKRRLLFIEPYCFGSHELFVQGLAEHTRHHIDVVRMPGKNFRWRMLGSALYLLDHMPPLEKYDGLIVTDMFNLCDFRALYQGELPPVLVYFHENQLTYPAPPGDKSVSQLGMINITTALAADRVAFNSETHRNAFLAAVPRFLNRVDAFVPRHVAEKIAEKSTVLYPGISLPDDSEVNAEKQTRPPLVIWNHRWGFDKNHETFFEVIETLQKKGFDFQLALMGENFGKIPEGFKRAQEKFKDRIVTFGYVHSRREYLEWLKRGAFVISTSKQENFGFSVIEAMIMKCIPFLPDRLCYPEILPEKFHGRFLYKSPNELVEKLASAMSDHETVENFRKGLDKKMKRFLWKNMAGQYNRMLEKFFTI